MKIKGEEVRNKERGITLVSLVVTIIIMLILAGIVISLTIGTDGIIEQAKQAKEKSEIAKNTEDIALMEYENEISKYISGSTSQNNLSYDNYISLKGVTGVSTHKKVLDSGVYEVNYFGSTFTGEWGIAYGQVFVNDECKFSERGSTIYSGSAGGCAYSCAGITSTITIEEKSEVYLRIASGPNYACGMITITKIKDI